MDSRCRLVLSIFIKIIRGSRLASVGLSSLPLLYHGNVEKFVAATPNVALVTPLRFSFPVNWSIPVEWWKFLGLHVFPRPSSY
jgi:hypothetical protein